MADEVETMFSAREVPWHGLGTVTDDVLTATDAITAAGLDWDVEMRQLYYPNGNKKSKIKAPNRFAAVRSTDDQFLGAVSNAYHVLQNREAFGFMDNLVDSGEAKYETAGSLRNGRTIFMTMKMPEDVLIGGEDRHEFYILLRNSHDGSSRVGVFVTPIRVVCMNTLSLGVGMARQRWEVTHLSSMEGKLQEARDTIKLTHKYVEEFTKVAEQLLSMTVTDEEIKALLETAIPPRPTIDKVITDIIDVYHQSPNVLYQGTAWGALGAVTEYYDHFKEARKPEARFTSITDGYVADIRNKTASLLLAR